MSKGRWKEGKVPFDMVQPEEMPCAKTLALSSWIKISPLVMNLAEIERLQQEINQYQDRLLESGKTVETQQ